MRKKYICLIIFLVLIINNDRKDNSFYKNINIIKNGNNNLVLVNKNNKLNNNFIPNNLVLIDLKYSIKDKYVKDIVLINFKKLHKKASSLGYKIIITSSYRSYYYQEKLYQYYKKTKGLKYADNCSARSGHSEHQTGLSIDVMGSNLDYNLFDQTKEFNWMKDNSYKYGFILRYPKNKEKITGFKYEPWHYRYVGKKVAKIIYKKKITLEEYYQNYIN